KDKIRLSQFLSEFENIPFKRAIFEEYMNLSTRKAQLSIQDLRDKMDILENVEGKGYRYQVTKKYRKLVRQGIIPSQFMELPGSEDKDFMPRKISEARGMIENTRVLFVSEEDSKKRGKFLTSLGNSLQEDNDVIYYSFQKHTLDDFISACIDHLSVLNMDGWFNKMADDKLELKDKISGLSGYIVQSLSKHRKTIIILEGIDVFYSGETQALIERMMYYWNPVQFVLGTTKQFVPQKFSNSMGLSELNL
ncbi:MAG: hypothetical protein U9R49_12140, partial [Bacteroidota bacterium]|nr:hypothetical protein [Bacteroidota bacterium]